MTCHNVDNKNPIACYVQIISGSLQQPIIALILSTSMLQDESK